MTLDPPDRLLGSHRGLVHIAPWRAFSSFSASLQWRRRQLPESSAQIKQDIYCQSQKCAQVTGIIFWGVIFWPRVQGQVLQFQRFLFGYSMKVPTKIILCVPRNYIISPIYFPSLQVHFPSIYFQAVWSCWPTACPAALIILSSQSSHTLIPSRRHHQHRCLQHHCYLLSGALTFFRE